VASQRSEIPDASGDPDDQGAARGGSRRSRGDRSASRGGDSLGILFIATDLGHGGAETQLVRAAVELARRDHRVAVLSLMRGEWLGTLGASLEAEGIEMRFLGLERAERDPRALWEALRFARGFRPDLICAFLFHATLLASILGPLVGRCPVVASIRDPIFGSRRRLLVAAALHRARIIDTMVTNSELLGRAFREEGLLDADRLEVIRNAVQVRPEALAASHRAEARRVLGMQEGTFTWVAVGNFQPAKDYPNLLEAFTILLERRPEARLRIIGFGEPPPRVRALLAASDDRITLLGPRCDVPDLLAAADALVMSSSSEGLPNVLMEALAEGTPVVSTAVGGVREIVDADSTGFLVPPRSAPPLAEAMERMMSLDPEARLEMGGRGRRAVQERFELSVIGDRWERLFRSLAQPRRRGG